MVNRRSFLATCAGGALAAKDSPLRIEHRVFPGLARMDGNWAALLAASDGKVYAGLAYHGGDGHLVYYDSRQDRMHDVGNLTELCGESHLKRGPQSKVHAKFGEGKDGRIYFGTHAGWWWNYARFATREGYPGAHWMAYDPKAGRVEDFGLGVPNEGINTGAYDPIFNRIYGLTHPRAHFVYYDVATKRTGDLGRINNWESICRTLGIDDRGNVYGCFGLGQIFRYDPRSDAIEELDVRVPIRPKGISLGRDYNKSETAWRSVVWDAKTRRFYGIEESATLLFSFEPLAAQPPLHEDQSTRPALTGEPLAGRPGGLRPRSVPLRVNQSTQPTLTGERARAMPPLAEQPSLREDQSTQRALTEKPYAGSGGEVRQLGQLCIPGFEERRDIPYATLSLTLGHDRKLYYGASGREFDYGGSTGAAASHLITWDLESGRKQDLGEMILSDGSRVLGTNAADTGPDGSVYLVGAIEVKQEKGKTLEAAGRVAGVPYRLALLIYKPRS